MGKEKRKRKQEELEDGNVDVPEKKKKLDETDADQTVSENKESTYEDKLKFVSVIAKPMASRKLAKKLFKLVRKATKYKTYLRNGLRDVQSRIRKGERGIVVFAGDITPVDMMCHLPAVCEEKNLPYIYTPSRADLGNAMGVNRGCLMVMIRSHQDYEKLFEECSTEIGKLPIPIYDPQQTL
ncbi:H/ACA ribonucleoprotein complex subunit 2-like protein [Centruroides vittatus]|uniref:H/ACA ribonucleoprotein complex subunit 2-like protein n=1 Tax=Centruroides vittatus TaxID=120091 RepID=UPI00350F8ABE